MSADVWGNLTATAVGVLLVVASIVLLEMRRTKPGIALGITAYIVLFPIHQWFWQFTLTDRGSLPHWYILSAVVQVVGALGFLIVLCLQRPFKRALTAISLAYVFSLFLQLFSYMYWVNGTPREFSVSLTHLDSFYVALGIFTTAGTGNISPVGETARGLQTLQMGLDFILIGFVVVLVMTRYTNLLDRSRTASPEDTPPVAPPREIPPVEPPADWSDAT